MRMEFADGGASFFENLPEAEPAAQPGAQAGAGGVSRTSTLSPRPGTAGGPEEGGAHHLGEAGESEAEIQRALFVGNYAAALDICLQVPPAGALKGMCMTFDLAGQTAVGRAQYGFRKGTSERVPGILVQGVIIYRDATADT